MQVLEPAAAMAHHQTHVSTPEIKETKAAERPEVAASDRIRRLMRLVPLWPHEVADTSYAGRLRLLSKLRGALRQERQKGLSGHWAYDLVRHRELVRTYRSEVDHCLKLGKKGRAWPAAQSAR